LIAAVSASTREVPFGEISFNEIPFDELSFDEISFDADDTAFIEKAERKSEIIRTRLWFQDSGSGSQ
jgi:hypothetical protein